MVSNGTPIWADIIVSDIERSMNFYREVLGWDFGEAAGDEFGGYRNAVVDDKAVAGMGPLNKDTPPEMAQLVGQWVTYLATSDVQATAEAMATHGAHPLMPPMEIGPFGHVALVADPQGALVGLWQAKSHVGFEARDTSGAICWSELCSPDVEAAKKFYGEVFKYSYESTDMEKIPYYVVSAAGEPPTHGFGEMPGAPGWGVVYQVSDVDQAVSRVENLGGTIEQPPNDFEFGRVASVTGPDGERFGIAQTKETPVAN